jgi:hypothetical protein
MIAFDFSINSKFSSSYTNRFLVTKYSITEREIRMSITKFIVFLKLLIAYGVDLSPIAIFKAFLFLIMLVVAYFKISYFISSFSFFFFSSSIYKYSFSSSLLFLGKNFPYTSLYIWISLAQYYFLEKKLFSYIFYVYFTGDFSNISISLILT